MANRVPSVYKTASINVLKALKVYHTYYYVGRILFFELNEHIVLNLLNIESEYTNFNSSIIKDIFITTFFLNQNYN